jgi:hypothetical protein
MNMNKGEQTMSRDKQIEEMAKTLCEDYGKCQKCTLSNPECENPCMIEEDCERLYNQGYRKESEVAIKAVDDFQSRLRNIFCTMCNDNDYNTVCLIEIDSAIECLFDMFVAELKKKYTESENDDE